MLECSHRANVSQVMNMNPLEKRDNLIAFRASTVDRNKAEELKLHMKLGSTAAVFRHLLDQSYQEMSAS